MDKSIIKKNALFLIDGSYLLYRSYYAMQALHTSHGQPIQAVYGFCRAIHALLQSYNPEYIAVVWDSPGGSFRNELFPAYKAHRQAPPSDLFEQKTEIMTFLDTIGMASIAVTGYEADDIIASLAHHNPGQTVLVCADKDLYQLLNERVLVIDIFKNKIVDTALFSAERGFSPDRMPLYLALLGDASDNIPGVNGIGDKTATELAAQFATLDQLYDNIASINKARTQKLLTEQKDNAYLSYQLAQLNCTDITYEQNLTLFNPTQWNKAHDFFVRLEFKSLLKTIAQQQPSIQPSAPAAQQSLFGPTPDTHATPTQQRTFALTCITTKQQLLDLIDTLQHQTLIALDTETTGLRPLQDTLLGISIAWSTDATTYIHLPALATNTNDPCSTHEALKLLQPILENAGIKKVLHNAKFDILVLANNGITLQGCTFDTLLAANVLRSAPWQKINLKDLSMSYLGEAMQTYAELLGKQYKSFADVPLEQAAAYAGHDALQTLKLYTIFHELLAKEPTLKTFFTTIEMPCMDVLIAMEKTGIIMQPAHLAHVDTQVTKELATVEGKITAALPPALAHGTFNIQSPRQIETLLFDHMQLPVVKKSPKGARSTDNDVLEELALINPIPALIIEYRELAKLKSTYLEPLPTYINPKTHRIHTTFNQIIAATGRLSSTDPNLQNIPAGKSYGNAVREAFVAAPGHMFISADYSQIELRVLAELSGDAALVDAFYHGRDIHTQTAAELFGVKHHDVTPEQRQLGKRINFSIIYGLTPFGLAKDLHIKPNEAKEYITKYFAQYPTVRSWMDTIVADATASGYVTTWAGKRRYIPELREKNKMLLELGKRIAINTPVQGTAADIMKLAMINVHQALTKQHSTTKIILQIHDELLLEAPIHEVEAVQHLVKSTMERVVNWKIPLDVSLRTGANWAEVSK